MGSHYSRFMLTSWTNPKYSAHDLTHLPTRGCHSNSGKHQWKYKKLKWIYFSRKPTSTSYLIMFKLSFPPTQNKSEQNNVCALTPCRILAILSLPAAGLVLDIHSTCLQEKEKQIKLSKLTRIPKACAGNIHRDCQQPRGNVETSWLKIYLSISSLLKLTNLMLIVFVSSSTAHASLKTV